MKNPTVKFIISLIIGAALSAGAALFPYASWLIIAVASVFFMVCAYRWGGTKTTVMLVAALAASLCAYCSFAIDADTLCAAVSNFCLLALSGAAMGLMARNNSDFRMVISGGIIINLASFLIEFAKFKFYYKLNLNEELINRPIAEFFAVYTEALSSINPDSAETMADAMGELQWFFQQIMATIMPSMLIITCAFIAYGVFLISRKIIFRKFGAVMERYPYFCRLQMPRSAAIVLVVSYVLLFFMSASPLSGAVTNIVILLTALYMVCGLSLADFFLGRMGLHWALRLAIYVAASIVLTLLGIILPVINIPTLLLFAGVADGMFDFRRMRFGGKKDEI